MSCAAVRILSFYVRNLLLFRKRIFYLCRVNLYYSLYAKVYFHCCIIFVVLGDNFFCQSEKTIGICR